jgi:glycosyltransferase involved in cell wall biosynthesis
VAGDNSSGARMLKPLILHVRASNFVGGPEKQIIEHVRRSRNADHIVLALADKGVTNEFYLKCTELGIRTEIIESRTACDLSIFFKMARVIRRLRPDIVCSHGYKPAVLLFFAKLGFPARWIAFARGHTEENIKLKLFQALERRLMRRADRVVSVSFGYSEYLKKEGIPEEHISVVHNAIDVKQYASISANGKRKELGIPARDRVIAAVGRLSPEKGHLDLIRAFPAIKAGFPDCRLLIIGDGPLLNSLQESAKLLSIPGIHFLGFRNDVHEILPILDVFVLPSRTEGFPNVVLEAFAHRIPVVATCVGGIPDIVRNNVNGILVQPGRPELLSGAVIGCLADRRQGASMGYRGHELVKSRFNWDLQTGKLESIYSEMFS